MHENWFVADDGKIGIGSPEMSKEWHCELFGTGEGGMILTPRKDNQPNWFWRKMQYLILGNKWIKKI